MYLAIHSPDYQLVAIFKLDDDQPMPTQAAAANAYFDANCSEFCTMREYPTLSSIPETL